MTLVESCVFFFSTLFFVLYRRSAHIDYRSLQSLAREGLLLYICAHVSSSWFAGDRRRRHRAARSMCLVYMYTGMLTSGAGTSLWCGVCECVCVF